MVRRFTTDSVHVTGLRDRFGAWHINHIASTKATWSGRWDKPGAYVGSVRKRHNKWYAEHDRAGGYEQECSTLTEAVDYLTRRDAIR